MVPFQALRAVRTCGRCGVPDRQEGGDRIKTAIHDFEGDQTYTEKRGRQFALNASFEDTDPRQYDALAIAGGRAPEYLRLQSESHRHRAAVRREPASRSPRLLSTPRSCSRPRGVIRGKRISAYPACAPEVKLAGGEYADIPVDAMITDNSFVNGARVARASSRMAASIPRSARHAYRALSRLKCRGRPRRSRAAFEVVLWFPPEGLPIVTG